MRIDPRTTPISIRGAWMSLKLETSLGSAPRGAGLYLRTNRSRPLAFRSLFRIVPACTESDAIVYSGYAGGIRITDPKGDSTDLFFETPSVLRMYGTLGLTIESGFISGNKREYTAHAAAYWDGPNRVVVNAKPWLRKYGVAIHRGAVSLTAPWDGELIRYADLRFDREDSGMLDATIEEFWSTWIPHTPLPPESAKTAMLNSYRSFHDGFVDLPQTSTAEDATALLWMCAQGPSGLLKREAIFMSLNWMDSIWSWDNWFNLLGTAAAHPELAFDQFRAIADHQDAFGAFPDSVNDAFLHFNFTKPPIQGVIWEMMQYLAPDFWTKERIREAYPSLAALTRWWLTYRRYPDRDLCHYLHGNDAGWDNATLLRNGVPVILPDLNAYLIAQCRMLEKWSSQIDDFGDESIVWKREGDRIVGAMERELWQDGTFIGVYVPDNQRIASESLLSIMPIVIINEYSESIRDALVENLRRFETDWGLASEKITSPRYEAENYWRGPIWAPATVLCLHGLRLAGEKEDVIRIAEKFVRLVEKSGFAENFHAETGTPLVDPAYTWTASGYITILAILKLCSPTGIKLC